MGAIAPELAAIVGPDNVQAWEQVAPAFQATLQAAVPGASPVVASPATPEELAAVMAIAHQKGWRVLPCGGGSKLDWGGLGAGAEVVLSTARLTRLVEHAVGDLTVTAEAGLTLAALQQTLAASRQFLALDPAYPGRATLGGIVATADTGALRQRYGGVRDMLIGLEFVRYDGQRVKAGGRVVKNVAGYDLMKLLTGSYGTLGILTQVTFRLYPQSETSQTVLLRGEGEAIARTAQTLLASALTPVAADLLTPSLLAALDLGEGFGLLARFQSVAPSVEEQIAKLRSLGQSLGLGDHTFGPEVEGPLWQRLTTVLTEDPTESTLLAKIGVEPAKAIATLQQLGAIASGAQARLHLASGLGLLRLDGALAEDPAALGDLRSRCEQAGGFLSVLRATPALKRSLDVWGYRGSAIAPMRQLKQQFDPNSLLSPQRFVGGI